MTRHRVLCTLAVSAMVLLSGTGCGNKQPATPSGSSPASSSSASTRGANDYSKPALTDAKMTKFIESLQEDQNPLEIIFKPGGAMNSMLEMKAREVEFNAYAHKYGFKDYVEYIDTWGRIMVGQMQLGAAKMLAGLKETTAKSVKEAEEKLKNPALSAEERQMYTEQLEQGKKSLAEGGDDGKGLNAADLALVEKYNTQINAAIAKRRNK